MRGAAALGGGNRRMRKIASATNEDPVEMDLNISFEL